MKALLEMCRFRNSHPAFDGLVSEPSCVHSPLVLALIMCCSCPRAQPPWLSDWQTGSITNVCCTCPRSSLPWVLGKALRVLGKSWGMHSKTCNTSMSHMFTAASLTTMPLGSPCHHDLWLRLSRSQAMTPNLAWSGFALQPQSQFLDCKAAHVAQLRTSVNLYRGKSGSAHGAMMKRVTVTIQPERVPACGKAGPLLQPPQIFKKS